MVGATAAVGLARWSVWGALKSALAAVAAWATGIGEEMEWEEGYW